MFWFETECIVDTSLKISSKDSSDIALRLVQILEAIQRLNPAHFKADEGLSISSTLEFPENWGLGSSSTLITNLAAWAKVDPFKLLELTFGGSGFDIACAQQDSAILYQLEKGETQAFNRWNFLLLFQSLCFLYTAIKNKTVERGLQPTNH